MNHNLQPFCKVSLLYCWRISCIQFIVTYPYPGGQLWGYTTWNLREYAIHRRWRCQKGEKSEMKNKKSYDSETQCALSHGDTDTGWRSSGKSLDEKFWAYLSLLLTTGKRQDDGLCAKWKAVFLSSDTATHLSNYGKLQACNVVL